MTFGTQNRLLVASSLILLLGASVTFGTRKMQRLNNGTWGGKHIQFEVGDGSVNIEYDCAHGSIEGPLTFDRQGRFSWHGTYASDTARPRSVSAKVKNQQARYYGPI